MTKQTLKKVLLSILIIATFAMMVVNCTTKTTEASKVEDTTTLVSADSVVVADTVAVEVK
jgi:hypothetical protein